MVRAVIGLVEAALVAPREEGHVGLVADLEARHRDAVGPPPVPLARGLDETGAQQHTHDASAAALGLLRAIRDDALREQLERSLALVEPIDSEFVHVCLHCSYIRYFKKQN